MMLQINHMGMVLNKQQDQYLYPYTFLIMRWIMIIKKKTKFIKLRSKYGVLIYLHFTLYSDKLTFDVDGTYEVH